MQDKMLHYGWHERLGVTQRMRWDSSRQHRKWGGIAWGLAQGVTQGVSRGLAWGVVGGVPWGVSGGVVRGLAWGVSRQVVQGVSQGVSQGVVQGLAHKGSHKGSHENERSHDGLFEMRDAQSLRQRIFRTSDNMKKRCILCPVLLEVQLVSHMT